MHDLTGFQRDILYVTAGLEEPHGLAIKDELDDLVDKGLLEKGELDKWTNVYTVTQRGLRETKARREWESQYLEDVNVPTTS